MLQTLRVKNLAIVENIRVDFADGLNVITGETGAGKSVVVGALGLILGERADKSLIRSGEERCGVEAFFQLADSGEVDTLLEDLGLDPCEDGVLVIRRLVAATGSGKILINDAPATVQALKRLGTLLVDMHGPHDHQSLLSPAFQLDLLDAYGHLWPARAAYEKLYAAMRELEERRGALDGDDTDTAAQI
ncbi:MAG: AAA family ATPase, partial [Verrucomicrobia bacterium]|nr:AAA family ATPase [Verrucomicrobiota bacterium]